MSEITKPDRYIIHCDMDAFYASVEQLKNPELKGKPVVVGGNPQSRGVVSTCSYEARKYGIRSAMPLAEAFRRCPGAVFLRPDFSAYKHFSSRMHKIFYDYTPLIEPISLDEAFLDVSGSISLFGPAQDIAQKIKSRVKNELGLTVSVGIAHNKFLAKLASDMSKPDGFLVVPPERVQEFLDPLDVGRLWGVGEKSAEKLRSLNIKTIKDVRMLNETYLTNLFGSFGRQLYLLARGLDNRSVETGRKTKSVGRENTFAVDIVKPDELERVVLELSTDVGRSLRKEGFKGRTVTLKIKYNDFKSITRSKTLEAPTNLDEIIYREARILLEDVLIKPIRLAGVAVSNLTDKEEPQLSLFENPDNNKSKLAQTIDLVKDKYGENSIIRARLLTPQEREDN